MDNFQQTERTTLKRLPKRGLFDRESVYKILDEGFVCHVGFVVDGAPVVIPTGYGRHGDNLFIHGSAASRMLRSLAGSIQICVTVTLVDGLVLARSAFHHSMNYRSVVIFGEASVVNEKSEKLEALRVISDQIIPERWNEVREPNESELKSTLVLRLPLKEVSAKVRTGPPLDDDEDYDLPIWAGEIPLELVARMPVPDPKLSPSIEIPSAVTAYVQRRRASRAIQIRAANHEDASAVAAVLKKAFTEYLELYTGLGFAATVLTNDQVKDRITEGPMWVAIEEREIVGTVAAVSKGDALYIRGMGIVPSARGKGIGELLLNHVEAFAGASGYKRMTLSTTPFLSRAISLYERIGFRRSDEPPLDLFGTPLFSMVKEL